MDTASSNIVRRFLTRNFLADDRFRPPKSVVNAVETGKLDSHVLLFWKDVVEKISSSPQGWSGSGQSYGAAVAYWRSKCAKNGYPLPIEYMEGLGGKGSQGRWSVKAGDEIEEWVKQTMYSQGLIASLVKTADEVRMDVTHTQRLLDDAVARAEKHKAGLASAATPKGLAQKQKWFDGAVADISKFEKELGKFHEQLAGLSKTVQKKDEATNYSIEFEKEFQFRMTVAAKSLDKKSVLDAVQKAVARFEKGLEIPGPYAGPPADEPDWEAQARGTVGLIDKAWDGDQAMGQARQAGILDHISGFLVKAWSYLKGAFDLFTDWASSLLDDTKSIAALLKEAGAE